MTDQIPLSQTESFRPGYKSLSKDLERLRVLVSDLYHDDRLFQKMSQALYAGDKAAQQIRDAYFARGLYAEIEHHHIHVAHGWMQGDMPDTFDRLIAAGKGQRVIRICRNCLALKKQNYWFLIDERKPGFKVSSLWAESRIEQKNEHQGMIGEIPEFKSQLLRMMDEVLLVFDRADATSAQYARLAAERADVEAEERRPPLAKPHPRKMDMDVFWEVVGRVGEDGMAAHIDQIPETLAQFSATAIKAFDSLLQELDARAYRRDVWDLAYHLTGGCSDDDFDAFRCWLILQGREVFEGTLADPAATKVSLSTGDLGASDALRDAALLAYEMRTGKPMKRKVIPRPNMANTIGP